jgi:hypothetical protein
MRRCHRCLTGITAALVLACSFANGQNSDASDENIPLLCAPGTSAALYKHAEDALKKSFLKCGDRLFLGLVILPTFACNGIAAPGKNALVTPRKCQAVEEFDSASFAAKETTGHADSLNHVLRGRLTMNYSASRLRHVTGNVWDEWAPNWQDKYGAEPYVLYDFREQNGAWSEELKLDALPSKLFVTADVDRRPSCAEILHEGPNGPQPGDGFVFGTADTRESRRYKGTIDGFAAALPGFIQRAVAASGAPARNYDKETAYVIDQVRKCASTNCSGAADQNVSDKVGGYDHDRERGLAMSMGALGLTVSVYFTQLRSDEGVDMFPLFDEYGIVSASLSPGSDGATTTSDRDTAVRSASGPPAAHLITDTYSQTMEKIKDNASRGKRDSYLKPFAGLIPELKVCYSIVDNKCQETGEVVRLPGDLEMPEGFWDMSSPNKFGACARHGDTAGSKSTEVRLTEQKDDKKRYLFCDSIWELSGLRDLLIESLRRSAPALSGDERTLRLTRTSPSEARTATITAPGNRMHNFNVFYIDTRDFGKGGTLVIDIDIPANSATDGSFDLFPGDASIPAQGPSTRPLTGRYDVHKGSSTHLDYRFGHGQVFALCLEGNWFSQKGATGLVKFRVSVSQ